MKELIQLQNEFQEYLFHVSDAIQDDIIETEKVPAEIRLSIYQNAYYSRLLEALETTYPILKKHMGEEDFESMGYEYIHQYYSTYRSIRWFGDKMEDFLSEHSDYRGLPYLSELSKFEWTMCLVFDAADADTVSFQEIGNVAPEDWENMRFKQHPSLHCLHLEWNVVAIWQALSENEIPAVLEKSDSSITWIAWRNDFTNHFCSLPLDEAWAMNAMMSGQSFGEICEGLCQWHDENETPMHAASLLKGWINAGLISGIYFEAALSNPLTIDQDRVHFQD